MDDLNTQYCSKCLCLDPDGKKTTSTSSTPFSTSKTTSIYSCEYMVRSFNSYNCYYASPWYCFQGDGYCDDEHNNQFCNWDGGDCCLVKVDMYYCSECLCLDPNTFNYNSTITFSTSSTTDDIASSTEASCILVSL